MAREVNEKRVTHCVRTEYFFTLASSTAMPMPAPAGASMAPSVVLTSVSFAILPASANPATVVGGTSGFAFRGID